MNRNRVPHVRQGNSIAICMFVVSAILFANGVNDGVGVDVDRETFRRGEAVKISVRLDPADTPVDAYLVVQVPGAQFFSLTAEGKTVPGISPVVRRHGPVHATATYRLPPITIPHDAPSGEYRLHAALCETTGLERSGRRIAHDTASFIVEKGWRHETKAGTYLEIWCVWGGGGSGTGTLIRGPDGTVVLFDEGGGSTWAGCCKELMDTTGITDIHYAIAGHYDSDHIGGLDDLVALTGGDPDSGYSPRVGTIAFYDRGGSLRDDGSSIPSSYYDFATKSGRRSTVRVDGSTDINLGNGAALRFLSVGAANTTGALYIRGRSSVTTGISENNKSISALVTYGGFDFYLGSDLEGSGEEAVDDVVVTDLGRDVDFLLVDHHGADTYGISSDNFFGMMNPEVAVISVWSNAHGHPRYNTVSRLQSVIEAAPQRIIRLDPGDVGHSDWAPENMSYCHTVNRHLYVISNGSNYTVDTVDRSGGNDLTDPGLVNHAADQSGGAGTPLPTPNPTPQAPAVVINEIAWGGTAAGSGDEWIELFNTTGASIDLTGWGLYEGGGTTGIITLSGSIAGSGYFLVERTDDSTVSDISGDTVGGFTGTGLSNSGEYLQLRDGGGILVDEVNCAGGWFAGSGSPDYYSMERVDPAVSGSSSSNWANNNGIVTNGMDANGASLNGTARSANSTGPAVPTATPVATATPFLLPDRLFFDDFPFSSIDTGKWIFNTGPAESDTGGINEPSGIYSLNLDGRTDGGDEIRSRIIDLSSYSLATLSYYWQRTGDENSPEFGEDLMVDYHDGSGWVNLFTYYGSGDDMSLYTHAFMQLPTAALHEVFQLRFRSYGTSHSTQSFDDWFVDDVEIRVGGGVVTVTPVPTATPAPTGTFTSPPATSTPAPGEPDSDGDGLADAIEQTLGTDAFLPDTDGDGLWDGYEHGVSHAGHETEIAAGAMSLPGTYVTDPLDADSDDDRVMDYAEVRLGHNPDDGSNAPASMVATRFLRALPGREEGDVFLYVANNSSNEATVVVSLLPRWYMIDQGLGVQPESRAFSVDPYRAGKYQLFDVGLNDSLSSGYVTLAHDAAAEGIRAAVMVVQEGVVTETHDFQDVAGATQLVATRFFRHNPGNESDDVSLYVANTAGADVNVTITFYPRWYMIEQNLGINFFTIGPVTIYGRCARQFNFFEWGVPSELKSGYISLSHDGAPGDVSASSFVWKGGRLNEIHHFQVPDSQPLYATRYFRQNPGDEMNDVSLYVANTASGEIDVTITFFPRWYMIEQNLGIDPYTIGPVSIYGRCARQFNFFEWGVPSPLRSGYISLTHSGENGDEVAASSFVWKNGELNESHHFRAPSGTFGTATRFERYTAGDELNDVSLYVANTTDVSRYVELVLCPDQLLSGEGAHTISSLQLHPQSARQVNIFEWGVPAGLTKGYMTMSHAGGSGDIVGTSFIWRNSGIEELHQFK